MKAIQKILSFYSGRICIFFLVFSPLLFSIHSEAQTITDYTKLSLSKIKIKANNNDKEAQFELGMRYKRGTGIAKNNENSVRWLKKAADNNHPEACGFLGDKYNDDGNYEQGLYYLRKGASLGDGRSYYFLFLGYDGGRFGLPKNEKLAGEFLIKSAEAKFGNFFVLACSYYYGNHGLSKNREKAIYWGKKSCDYDYANYLKTGVMPKEGDGWPYLIKWLKELGCDYDPALYVDEYQSWLKEKSVVSEHSPQNGKRVNSNIFVPGTNLTSPVGNNWDSSLFQPTYETNISSGENTFNSSEILNQTVGENCFTCKGTGKCHACNGTKVAQSFGNSYRCTVCDDYGNCPSCKGNGKASWNR